MVLALHSLTKWYKDELLDLFTTQRVFIAILICTVQCTSTAALGYRRSRWVRGSVRIARVELPSLHTAAFSDDPTGRDT